MPRRRASNGFPSGTTPDEEHDYYHEIHGIKCSACGSKKMKMIDNMIVCWNCGEIYGNKSNIS